MISLVIIPPSISIGSNCWGAKYKRKGIRHNGNYIETVECFQKAAEQGYSDAIRALKELGEM